MKTRQAQLELGKWDMFPQVVTEIHEGIFKRTRRIKGGQGRKPIHRKELKKDQA